MTDKIFGPDVTKAYEYLKENMPRLERKVETCDLDTIRLVRSLSYNNCRARSNGEIDLTTFSNNHAKIIRLTEKFIDKCICTIRK